MLPLIRTLFDICIFRKGPEDIPYSWFLLYVAVILHTVVLFVAARLIESLTITDIRNVLLSWFVGLLCFGFVVLIARKSGRLVQTLTALVGVSALITLLSVLFSFFGGRILSDELMTSIANLVTLWWIVIKGHIIARAVDWHWYAGLLISIAILFIQVAVPADLLGLT